MHPFSWRDFYFGFILGLVATVGATWIFIESHRTSVKQQVVPELADKAIETVTSRVNTLVGTLRSRITTK